MGVIYSYYDQKRHVEFDMGCPQCGNPKLSKCSSDATEYAWFHFKGWQGGCPQGRGHWEVLRVCEIHHGS